MSSTGKSWLRRTAEVLCVMIVVVVADQASKVWAVETLKGQPGASYLGDLFRIVYAENTGGFLSLGSSLPASARFLLLTVINAVVLIAGLGYVMMWKKLNPLVWWGVTLLVAGGIGNLIDRVRLDGRVIDFLNLGIGNLRTGIFNVADMAISLGVVLFFISTFQAEKKSSTDESEAGHPVEAEKEGPKNVAQMTSS